MRLICYIHTDLDYDRTDLPLLLFYLLSKELVHSSRKSILAACVLTPEIC
jgi:hypothetical protein